MSIVHELFIAPVCLLCFKSMLKYPPPVNTIITFLIKQNQSTHIHTQNEQERVREGGGEIERGTNRERIRRKWKEEREEIGCRKEAGGRGGGGEKEHNRKRASTGGTRSKSQSTSQLVR